MQELTLKIQQKLINACNKITLERDWFKIKIEHPENNYVKPELKFEKTLIDNIDATMLLCTSTQLIYFDEIFSKKEYIDTILDLFDIQEECRKNIEHVFNYSIYEYVKNQNNEIKLIKNIINLTDVSKIIDKCLEDRLDDDKFENTVANYIHSTTELDLEYCKYITPDIIDKFLF